MQSHKTITRRVLVISPNAENGKIVEQATRAWIFETKVCSSLCEARNVLADGSFAAVFCDERLPDGTYADLLALIGGIKKIPVAVLTSGPDQDSTFRKAMELGALGVLPNPCSARDAQWMVIRATQQGTAGTKPGSRWRDVTSAAISEPGRHS